MVLRCYLSVQDHPHACGDKSATVIDMLPALGSSPRVWGQVTVFSYTVKDYRIIPTRVGTSVTESYQVSVTLDHPHACGDKDLSDSLAKLFTGSSPRVWGQEDKSSVQRFLHRIIPTRVGTSRVLLIPCDFCWDHPHACGDK